jgi:hypothetical protein
VMFDEDSLSDVAFRARWLSVFVPEGLNDRSQAIYCLECVQKSAPSRRDGMSRANRCFHRPRNVRRFVLPTSPAGAKAQKKYSPPHPLDTKGCCSPQNNPKKSSSLYCLRFQGISNDLFVHCTNRFSCILQDLILFHQIVVIYWRAECWDGAVGWRFEYISSVELLSGVLSVTDTN